jgi:hypothetical protein
MIFHQLFFSLLVITGCHHICQGSLLRASSAKNKKNQVNFLEKQVGSMKQAKVITDGHDRHLLDSEQYGDKLFSLLRDLFDDNCVYTRINKGGSGAPDILTFTCNCNGGTAALTVKGNKYPIPQTSEWKSLAVWSTKGDGDYHSITFSGNREEDFDNAENLLGWLPKCHY